MPEYEGLYEASTLGHVRSLDRTAPFKCRYGQIVNRTYKGKLLSQMIDSRNNYLQVVLSKDGYSRRELVHRIIAKTFIDNPDNLPEINHKDEDKTNNAVSNLEWCDHAYNNTYGSKLHQVRGSNNPRSKITPEIVQKIRYLVS